MEKNKKKILKGAIEESKAHEAAESPKKEKSEEADGKGGPSFGNNPGTGKAGVGTGSLLSKKYKNLSK